MTMKRKELDDEFSDFSLSSPATKIRRLDAGFPPIMEEESQSLPVVIPPPRQQEISENEERAIVLFKPKPPMAMDNPSFHTYSLNSRLLSALKSTPDVWSNLLKSPSSEVSNQCLAVVPWVQSQIQVIQEEADDNQVASMDIEEEEEQDNEYAIHQWQQQQQHCMVPQNAAAAMTTTTPLVWYPR